MAAMRPAGSKRSTISDNSQATAGSAFSTPLPPMGTLTSSVSMATVRKSLSKSRSALLGDTLGTRDRGKSVVGSPREGPRRTEGAGLLGSPRPDFRNLGSKSRSGLGSNESPTIKVCVRVRPFIKEEIEGNRSGGRTELCVSMPSKKGLEVWDINLPEETRSFHFDRCYWSHSEDHPLYATQATLHEEIGKTLLEHAMDGYNNCIFAYGQTGSGKSFSVIGGSGAERGLLPRVVEGLFEHFDQLDEGTLTKASVSFLEIYNEQIFDLLDGRDGKRQQQQQQHSNNLQIKQHPILGTIVPGLEEAAVASVEDVMAIINYGLSVRTVAETRMNAQSSRSHCIFTIKTSVSEDGGLCANTAQTHLVDLAGSERSSRTRAQADRLKEGAAINKSLATLARVISELAKKKSPGNPPFRESKLTFMLKESLCGNSKTVMMAAISPSAVDYDETISTLKFAQSAKQVQTKAVANRINEAGVEEQLRRELELLRAQLSDLQAGRRPADSVQRRLKEQEQLCQWYGKDWHTLLSQERQRNMRRNALVSEPQAMEEIASMAEVHYQSQGLETDPTDETSTPVSQMVDYLPILTFSDSAAVGEDPSMLIVTGYAVTVAQSSPSSLLGPTIAAEDFTRQVAESLPVLKSLQDSFSKGTSSAEAPPATSAATAEAATAVTATTTTTTSATTATTATTATATAAPSKSTTPSSTSLSFEPAVVFVDNKANVIETSLLVRATRRRGGSEEEEWLSWDELLRRKRWISDRQPRTDEEKTNSADANANDLWLLATASGARGRQLQALLQQQKQQQKKLDDEEEKKKGGNEGGGEVVELEERLAHAQAELQHLNEQIQQQRSQTAAEKEGEARDTQERRQRRDDDEDDDDKDEEQKEKQNEEKEKEKEEVKVEGSSQRKEDLEGEEGEPQRRGSQVASATTPAVAETPKIAAAKRLLECLEAQVAEAEAKRTQQQAKQLERQEIETEELKKLQDELDEEELRLTTMQAKVAKASLQAREEAAAAAKAKRASQSSSASDPLDAPRDLETLVKLIEDGFDEVIGQVEGAKARVAREMPLGRRRSSTLSAQLRRASAASSVS